MTFPFFIEKCGIFKFMYNYFGKNYWFTSTLFKFIMKIPQKTRKVRKWYKLAKKVFQISFKDNNRCFWYRAQWVDSSCSGGSWHCWSRCSARAGRYCFHGDNYILQAPFWREGWLESLWAFKGFLWWAKGTAFHGYGVHRMDRSDVINLIGVTRTQDEYGVWRPTQTSTQVFCQVDSCQSFLIYY